MTEFFKEGILWIEKIWNEKLPDTFIVTKKQYIFLIIVGLVLCIYQAIRKKKAKQEYTQQVISEAKKLQRFNQTIPKGPKILGKNWFPTGWTYNEERKLWEPPDYLKAEAKDRWVWNPEKEVWIDLYKQKKQ